MYSQTLRAGSASRYKDFFAALKKAGPRWTGPLAWGLSTVQVYRFQGTHADSTDDDDVSGEIVEMNDDEFMGLFLLLAAAYNESNREKPAAKKHSGKVSGKDSRGPKYGNRQPGSIGRAGRQESHEAVKHLRTTILKDFEEEANDLVDIKINVVQTTVENFGRLCIHLIPTPHTSHPRPTPTPNTHT